MNQNSTNTGVTSTPQISAKTQPPVNSTNQVVTKPIPNDTKKKNSNHEQTVSNIDSRVKGNSIKFEKNPKLKSFRYTVLNSVGKKEVGTFDAETEAEVKNFLVSQGYQIVSIKPRSSFDFDIGGTPKLKAGDLSFYLTQLSTYIKAGIPLADSVRILAKQINHAGKKKIFNQLVYELLRGENLSNAMAKQGSSFPPLLINMVKTSELTGDLPSILDDMSDYYTTMDQTKKQMVSAMIYPVVVLVIAIAVLIFMLVYLVPQFASMFESNDAKLPGITLFILNVSKFIQLNYIYLIASVFVVVVVFWYLYKKVTSFRTLIQVILMHTPVVSKIIIYNEIANFTKTFASLINHGVFITDSMEILGKITNNEIYKKIINNCLTNLASGETISKAFKGQWAVPIVAYEMIVTGENTGQLGQMMEKVATHFQNLHKNIIDRMKSLIEPLMICMLAGIVGVILLSIVQPMFSIYDQVK